MYIVYALWNESVARIYIGQTNNLERRVVEHNTPSNKFTGRVRGEWELIYQESVPTRSEAIKREKQLKSYRGREFIKSHIPE